MHLRSAESGCHSGHLDSISPRTIHALLDRPSWEGQVITEQKLIPTSPVSSSRSAALESTVLSPKLAKDGKAFSGRSVLTLTIPPIPPRLRLVHEADQHKSINPASPPSSKYNFVQGKRPRFVRATGNHSGMPSVYRSKLSRPPRLRPSSRQLCTTSGRHAPPSSRFIARSASVPPCGATVSYTSSLASEISAY